MKQAHRPVHRPLLFALLLITLALCGAAGTAHAQAATAAIAGHLLNGSAANAPVAGATVQLYRFDGSNKTIVGSVQSAADGGFRFDGLQIDSTFQYAAAASFDSVTYASDAVILQPGQTAQADVIVYASTDSGGTISVTRMSIVFAGADAKAGILTIVESYHLNNSAGATYIGAATGGVRQTLTFPLYTGARSLTALDGFAIDQAVATTGGFALTSPVLPGDSVVTFTYDLPYQNRSLALQRTLAYPTALAEVILPDNMRIASPQLLQPSSVQLGGRSFNTIQGMNLPAGARLELDVAGLPARPQPLVNLSSLPIQVAVVGLILALVASGVLYERRRGNVATRALAAERRELLRRIADLDDGAERGATEGAAYETERGLALARVGEIDRALGADALTDAPELRAQGPVAHRTPTDTAL